MDNKMIQHLVTRDVIAGMFASIRAYGVENTLKQMALEYTKAFGSNVHIEWYIKENNIEIPK